jgi:zinc protease
MILIFALSGVPASAFEGEGEVRKKVLDNGARILCRQLPGSGLTAIQIRVLSGLSNEGRYAGSGISHFLEHLLFKGTEDKDAEVVRKEIKSMGGIVNASTGMDSAEYHIIVPNENFPRALKLLTEMVMEPVFRENDLETERKVILREINMRRDNPSSRRIRLLFANAYLRSVYRYPIIGHEELLRRLSRDDILEYHSRVYTPDRLVLGVVGGVDPEKAAEAAAGALAPYKRAFKWENMPGDEPAQTGPRCVTVNDDVALGYLAMGFHTTSLYSGDLYATDVLSVLLGGGRDSRLYRKLVNDEGLLYTVNSANHTPRYPGLFIVTGAGEPGDMEKATEGIFSVIAELKDGNIDEKELERVKNLVIAEYLHSREKVHSMASSITISELLTGDPRFFRDYVERIRDVGPEDIKRVAARFLTERNSTLSYIMPHGSGGVSADRIFRANGAEKEDKEHPEKVYTATRSLSNGLKLIVQKRSAIPLVSVTYVSGGGVISEASTDNGISNLTARSMLKGTGNRGESDLVPAVERMGGSLSSFSGMNTLGLNIDLMSGDYERGMDIFEDVLKNASFPVKEVDKVRKKVIAAIRQQDKDIFEKGTYVLGKLIYGEHPYSLRVLGKADVVRELTVPALKKYYKEHVVPGGAVICVVGDVDAERILEDLSRRFSGWRGPEPGTEVPEVPPVLEERREDITMDKQQSLYLAGYQNVDIHDERKYPVAVASSLLSGSDGLLFLEAREQEGLTYASGAVSVPQLAKGYFIIYVATEEKDLDAARRIVRNVVERARAGEVSGEDVAAASAKLISQHARSLQTNSSRSMTMALDEYYGLGYDNYLRVPDRFSSVTKEQVVESVSGIFGDKNRCEVIVHSRDVYGGGD